MEQYNYDMIAIGAGAGGFVSAKVAAGFGKKVAMIEKDKLGGACTNAGCVPSKAFVKAASIAHQARHLQDYGLEATNGFAISGRSAMKYVRSAVKKVYDGHPASVFEKAGIDVHFGSPRFMDNHRIVLGDRTLTAEKFMLCTGSSPLIPAIEGLESTPYYTNENIFQIETLPNSMLVLGGGPIGVELASALNRLGVATTLIEAERTILPREDHELVGMLMGQLRNEGLRILTDTRSLSIKSTAAGVALDVQNSRNERETLTAEAILIAVGRRPNLDDLNLEQAGVGYGPKGVVVDNYLRTTAPNIYACGDIVGPYQFSHVTEYEAISAVRNAFLPFRKAVTYDTVAWCTFTSPELAHAGMTEDEARERFGDKITVLRYDYGKIDRSRMDNTEFGMAKFICNRFGKLLGAHILGERAGDLIHEVQLLRHFRRPFTDIASMSYVYPTYTDVIRQPAKYYYVDRLRNSFAVKFAARIWSATKRNQGARIPT